MKISVFSVVDHYPDGQRSKHRLYSEVVEQAVLADTLGYDSVLVAEHHFIDYGIVPNPAVLLAHIAARTRRVKLGPAVSILPFRDPRQVAEDYVMLDILSQGRALLGVGSGYVAPEYSGFALDVAEKHPRFAEALAVIRQLVAGKRATLDGRYSTLKDVGLNVQPVQSALELSVATGNRASVAAIGAQGDSLMFMAYTMCEKIAEARAVVSDYRAGRKAGKVAVGFHTHVGASDAEARSTAKDAFDRYCSTRVKARKRGYDEAVNDGVVLFGSPDTVAQQIIDLRAMGVNEVLTLQNFGALPAAAVQASMTRLMNEVMPKVRQEEAA